MRVYKEQDKKQDVLKEPMFLLEESPEGITLFAVDETGEIVASVLTIGDDKRDTKVYSDASTVMTDCGYRTDFADWAVDGSILFAREFDD